MALFGWSCGSPEPDSSASPLQPVAPPAALFSGCLELTTSQCTLEKPSKISVWLDVHSATPLDVRVDGQPVEVQASPVAAGTRLTMRVDKGAERIEIQHQDSPWESAIGVNVVWETTPAWKAKVEAIPKVTGKAKALRSVLKTAEGWSRLRALDLLRRAEYELEDYAASEKICEQQIALAQKLDAPAHQVYALAALVNMAVASGQQLPRIFSFTERLDALRDATPKAAMRADYAHGMVARATGDIDAALDHLRAARIRGEQLGEVKAQTDVIGLEAATLAELGRVDDALLLSARVRELARTIPCQTRLTVLVNYGWTHIALRTQDLPFEDPEPILVEALALGEECGSSWDHSNNRIELAINAIEDDDPNAALGWLAQIEVEIPDLTPWREEAYGRAASMLGDPSLQPSLLRLPLTASPNLRWNQHVREADALHEWGFLELAAEKYRDAEALLDAQLETIRIDSGSELYLAGRRASAQGLVETLLDLGDPEQALCAARLARARELARLDRVARVRGASPEDQEAWRTQTLAIAEAQAELDAERTKLWELDDARRQQAEPRLAEQQRQTREQLDAALRGLGLDRVAGECDALRKPGPGELLLTSTPVRTGHAVFAASSEGIEVALLGDEGLSPLEGLGRAERITIIELGSDPQTPLHAQPWRDAETLLDLAPVGYSLDVPPRLARPATETSALLVTDPRGDLPQARAESDSVSGALEREGWSVREHRGSGAGRDALVKALPTVDLLHYAGHGVREGLSGWDSALLLANDERLSVHDLFTLPSVPRGVVLTGCETGAMTAETTGGGMNIGRAFVLSGADWVIAADSEVDDGHARLVGEALYGTDTAADGPTRLREALLRLRDSHPDLPWQRFRAIVP